MDILLIRSYLAIIFAGLSCSLIGVLLVTLNVSFLGICMSHAAFLGVLVSLILGINPFIGALVCTSLTAGIIGPIADKSKITPETSIGIMFSAVMGLAFIFMKFLPNSTMATDYLWGSVLTLSNFDVLFLGILALVICLILTVFGRQITIVLFDRVLATSFGINAKLIFYTILICCGLVTTASIGSIGGLLVFSLILNPAVSAYQLTFSIKKMFILAALFGVGACVIGLSLAWWLDLPVGATTVVTSTVLYVISLFFSVKR
ncbi:MAG: metal ABC transporter permease [Abditibacteriota bacterium]|nr:metal ABC transporter permease [Abditibacteriota bacterium]